MTHLLQKALPAIVLLIGPLNATPVLAQVPSDSITGWTERLRTGTLIERLDAAQRLAGESVDALAPMTRSAVVDAFVQLNTQLRSGGVPGAPELGPEGLGEYYLALAGMVYAFDTPEARRALALSAGGSSGMQRRAAKQGDDVIPLLSERIRDGYEAADALETMALAWFWADSTGAPLSDASRATIVEHLTAATSSDDYALLRSVPEALRLIADPAFLPLARWLEERADAEGHRLILGAVREALPALSQAADAFPLPDLARRIERAVAASCANAAPGPRRGACQSIQNQMTAGIRHLEAGRTGPARNVFESVVRRADQALAAGALEPAEHALVAGGVREVLDRL